MRIKKLLLKILIAIPFFALLISSVNADIDSCESAFKNQKYDLAFELCSESDLYPYDKARFVLAVIFENGYGNIKQNQVLSCRIFNEIDKKEYCNSDKKIDSAIAAINIDNFDRAIRYLTPFAEINNSKAQYYLSLAYAGLNDNDLALSLLEKSAKSGFKDAIELLIKANNPEIVVSTTLDDYEDEKVVEKPVIVDREQKVIAYEIKPNICTSVFQNNELEECLTFLRAYSKSDYDKLGTMYYIGQGVSQNYKKAEFWYLQSALEGYPEGQYKLANLYYLGLSGNKDYKESTRWFLKAAENGHTFSQYRLGAIYHYGITGINTDKKASIFWLTKASNKGNKAARNLLNKILNSEPIVMVEVPTGSSFIAFFDEVILPKLSFINLVIFLVVVGGINSIIERIKEKRKIKKALAKFQKEAEEKALKDAKERAQKEIDDLAKLVAEEKAKKAIAKEKKEAEVEAKKAVIIQAKKEFQEKTKKKAEQKAMQDAKDKAKKDAEEKAKKDAEEKAKSLAEVKRAEAAKRAGDIRRAERRAEEKTRNDALKAEKATLTALEKAMKDAKAKAEQDSKDRIKKEVEEKEGEKESQTSKPKFKFKSKKRFEIINFKTGSEKWFEWRSKGIGSHDAKLICDKKEDKLFEREKIKGSHVESLKENERLLAKGRALYEEKTGIKVFPLLIQDKRSPWLQATIDGFTEDFTKLLMVGFGEESIKNAQKMKKQSNQSMSLSQVARAQHLLMITGLEEVDYWCYDISGDKTPVLLTIKRDQKKIKQLYELEKKIGEQLNEDEVDNLSKQFTDILKGAGMKF